VKFYLLAVALLHGLFCAAELFPWNLPCRSRDAAGEPLRREFLGRWPWVLSSPIRKPVPIFSNAGSHIVCI